MQKRILIIDDDRKLNKLLIDFLTEHDFNAHSATHPREGLRAMNVFKPDLIILDIMLPDMDGFEVLREVRKSSEIPILMLTARGDTMDRILGLEIGADDYLPKPFEPRELVARIRAIFRRQSGHIKQEFYQTGKLKINVQKYEAFLGSDRLDLTTSEFEILSFFFKNSGIVLNRDQIMDNLRGIEWDAFNRSIDVLISRLRQKLKDDPKNPKYIKTVWGAGYMFIGDDIG